VKKDVDITVTDVRDITVTHARPGLNPEKALALKLTF
jgi:hypothetical protein